MEVYIGTICAFGFNFAPYGWFECQGQLVPISQYTALFSLLGTYYGGNGTSNFGLPNFQGVVAKGMGQGPGLQDYIIGETGGATSVSILYSNMPAHSHTFTMTMNVDAQGNTGNTGNPNGAFLATGNGSAYASAATAGAKMKISSSGGVTLSTDSAGSATPITLQAPTQVMNYCICNYGIFPSRN